MKNNREGIYKENLSSYFAGVIAGQRNDLMVCAMLYAFSVTSFGNREASGFPS